MKLVVRRTAASRVAQFYCEMNRYGNRFMQLGYGRVSTNEQDTAARVSALKSAGCEKIFQEKALGQTPASSLSRPTPQGRCARRLAPRQTFAIAPGRPNDHGADSRS
jgi:hypothetical protein